VVWKTGRRCTEQHGEQNAYSSQGQVQGTGSGIIPDPGNPLTNGLAEFKT
jgi:hypothetical protein